MWIRRKEYDKLIDEKQYFVQDAKNKDTLYRNYAQRYRDLLYENANLREQLEQLKVKYADEVRKNFELASYLSEIKKDQEVQHDGT